MKKSNFFLYQTDETHKKQCRNGRMLFFFGEYCIEVFYYEY
jgi:hypothetical protein